MGVINLLLKKGADVSVTDKDGVTTLMSAASHGHQQVTRDNVTNERRVARIDFIFCLSQLDALRLMVATYPAVDSSDLRG